MPVFRHSGFARPKIHRHKLAAECKALESDAGWNEPDPSVHSTYQMIQPYAAIE